MNCSQGPIPQVVPKNKSNKQLTETPLEAYVSSTLYEVEEERVGVPVKRRLYEVWRRRRDKPSGFFASHADLKVPGICILQSLFTGEDDTWKSWL
ncbi:hypothetical protein Bca52824_064520 [Brassica carinata]|uniref:Uncharacterized protein n=1 Tax=Brassica carinata TaxID=52824 RepID=A0A8X7QJW6_BRACI|nr:hypothetical protein Bca52824_064520 [Brassica carinata]